MFDTSNNKFDIIIIIILSLMVAFFIGFNIINLIDSKLSAVTIHVPPQKCQVPPIYLTLDKDSKLKQVNISDTINGIKSEPKKDNKRWIEKLGILGDLML